MKSRRPELARGDGMDHATALEAANQALGGRASRATNRFASVELRGVDELGRTGREAKNPEDGAGAALPSGAWELAAMISVAIVTLLIVVVLWML
jgi:hypothetical protein